MSQDLSHGWLRDNGVYVPLYCSKETGKLWSKNGKVRHYFFPMFICFVLGIQIHYRNATNENNTVLPVITWKGKRMMRKRANKIKTAINESYYDFVTMQVHTHPEIKDDLIAALAIYPRVK